MAARPGPDAEKGFSDDPEPPGRCPTDDPEEDAYGTPSIVTSLTVTELRAMSTVAGDKSPKSGLGCAEVFADGL